MEIIFLANINCSSFKAAIKKLSESMQQPPPLTLAEELQQLVAQGRSFTESIKELEDLANAASEVPKEDRRNHRKKGKEIKSWNRTKFYQK